MNNTPSTLKILIVEDDFSFALELEILVKKIGYQIAGCVDNSAEALEMIFTQTPDLILMDIDIKGKMTGIEIGQKIKYLNIPILYITSFDDEATYEAAQQSQMIGYLVKPINKFSLISAINLAIANLSTSKADEVKLEETTADFVIRDAFFFKKKNIYHKVEIENIAYIESDDKYCLTHTTKGEKFVARIAISNIEKSLLSEEFLRIHRSYIVALQKITSVNFYEGTLRIGDKELPVSRANRKILQEMMNRLE